MDIQETLIRLNKKLSKIEESDANFTQNPKWLELRRQQDEAYNELAKSELEYFIMLNNKYSYDPNRCEFFKKKINEYRKYLGMENGNTL